ncbi:MAG: HAD hydrolase-like protein, partial [Acidobacteriota bacterium]
MRRLILFDIDGTLLLCGRQVGPIFIEAMRAVYGDFRRPEGYSFAGKTDPMIVRDMVRALGLSEPVIEEGLPRMRDLYVERLDRDLDPAQMRVLAGVVDLLDRLSDRDDILLGLLTGNWRRGAEVKLSRLGLDRYFDFDIGAFGGDGRIRRDLVPVALDRAGVHRGRAYEPD